VADPASAFSGKPLMGIYQASGRKSRLCHGSQELGVAHQLQLARLVRVSLRESKHADSEETFVTRGTTST